MLSACPTFVLRIDRDFTDRGLQNADITIECSAECPTQQSNPEVRCEADYQERNAGTCGTEKQYRLAAYTV